MKTISQLHANQIQSLKSRAMKIDENKKIPDQWLEHIYEKGLFHLFVPQEIHDFEIGVVSGEDDFPATVALIEQYAQIDGNLGWLIQIGAGAGVFAAYLDSTIAKQFFGSSHSVVAGSGYATGTAVRENEGYRINGQWKYASGIGYATMITANCIVVENGVETSNILSIIMSPDTVTIDPTWNGMGLRATDSHSFIADDVWIPETQTFVMNDNSLRCSSPLYRLPFYYFARAVFMPVIIGMKTDYLETIEQWMNSKFDSQPPALLLETVEAAVESLTQIKESFYNEVQLLWELAEQNAWDVEKENNFSQLCIESTTSILNSLQACHRYTGMEGGKMDTRLNQIFRNIITGSGHFLLSPLSMVIPKEIK